MQKRSRQSTGSSIIQDLINAIKGNDEFVFEEVVQKLPSELKRHNLVYLSIMSTCSDADNILSLICRFGTPGMLRLLFPTPDKVQSWINECSENGPPLCFAASFGNTDVVEYLVGQGALINNGDNSELPYVNPLSSAAFGGHTETVRCLLLLKAEPNPTPKARNPLRSAAAKGNLDVVKVLVDAKAEVNFQEQSSLPTPLVAAVKSGSLTTAEFLLSVNADPNLPTYWGQTALAEALSTDRCPANEWLSMVKTILSSRADPNQPIKCGRTPLEDSVDHPAKVSLLLRYKADPNYAPPGRPTVLIAAVQKRRFDTVQLLLDARSDPNQGEVGNTPLLFAIRNNSTEMMEVLLAAGATPLPDEIQEVFRSTGVPSQRKFHVMFHLLRYNLTPENAVARTGTSRFGTTLLDVVICEGFFGGNCGLQSPEKVIKAAVQLIVHGAKCSLPILRSLNPGTLWVDTLFAEVYALQLPVWERLVARCIDRHFTTGVLPQGVVWLCASFLAPTSACGFLLAASRHRCRPPSWQ